MDAIDFQPLAFEHKSIFDRFYQAGYYENAHFNFTNLFIWRKMFHIVWREMDDILYIMAQFGGVWQACQPVCSLERLPQAIGQQLEDFANLGVKPFIPGLEKNAADYYADYKRSDGTPFFSLESNKSDFDYLYSISDLANLAGNRYHKKKNHLNAFRRAHPEAKFFPIDKSIIPLCLKELDEWYNRHLTENAGKAGNEYLPEEYRAVREIFAHYDDFKLFGGAILIGERVIAFSFGERLNADTIVVHVEKADPDIRGAYVAINQEFSSYLTSKEPGILYLNREEDMGLDGLRQAKESWRPVRLIEKFVARSIE